MCDENFYEETARQHLRRIGIDNPNDQQLRETKDLMFNVFISCKIVFSDQLSKREKQCLYCTSIGKSAQKIAEFLEITVNTVRQYQKSCMKKLNCHTMAQAVAMGIKYGELNF